MTQQVVNIGTAPDDGTGDQLRVAFDKCNDNFTELYQSGAGSTTEGVWNYNQTSTDTSSAPTSGRFRTNSGDAAGATQIAIHRISINGIDRANTLRTQVAGDIIKCQESSNADTWARYTLQSIPIDNGTWFQLNVAFDSGGGTPPGNNQEIIFGFTASGGGSSAGGNVSNSGTPTVGQYGKWVTATTIQGVAPATVLSDIGAQPAGSYAPLASPVFTGDPQAPTPATVDNDTSVATTAFVKAQSYITSSALTPYAPLASPALSGNPTAPTPTAGDNDTSVATTAFVTTAIAGKADTSTLASYALLASPTFTGDPKAPTPATADNDTSIATTAYVQAQGYLTSAGATAAYQPLDGDLTSLAAAAGINAIYYRSAADTWSPVNVSTGLAFAGGNLTSTVTSGAPVGAEYITSTTDATLTAERVLTDTATVTWDRTTAGQIKANAVASGGGTSAPQGRLTLQTLTPVMTTTQAAKATLYYSAYCGNLVPIYDGANFTMSSIGAELSVLTTDTTKSPAAIGASKINDWFVWNDAGTIRVGHGPDWTNDTTRSAGTALVMVNGILLNNAAITNGPAASRGTYVGTTRSNASSQLDWIYGAVAATPVAGVFGVWNMYNRVCVSSLAGDLTDSWTYALATVRAANAKTTARHSFVSGMAEDVFEGVFNSMGSPTVAAIVGICYDVINAFSGVTGCTFLAGAVSLSGNYITTALGFHFFQAGESTGGANTATFYGDNADATLYKTGIIFKGWM